MKTFLMFASVVIFLGSCFPSTVQTGPVQVQVFPDGEEIQFDPILSEDGKLQADCREVAEGEALGRGGVWLVLRGLVNGGWTDLYKTYETGSCGDRDMVWKLYAAFLAGTQVYRDIASKAGLDPNQVNDLLRQLRELTFTP